MKKSVTGIALLCSVLFFVSVKLSVPFAGALVNNESLFSEIYCDDKGVITFELKPQDNNLVAINTETNESIPVKGEWYLQANFRSNERLFHKPGTYSLTSNGTLKYFTCPGLSPCLTSTFTDISCAQTKDTLSGGFTLEGMDIVEQDLKFTFKIIDNGISRLVSQHSLSDFSSTIANNTLSFVARPEVYVESFEISHKACTADTFIFARTVCNNTNSPPLPSQSLGIDCSNILNVNDRISCKIRSGTKPYTQEDCTTHTNTTACIATYEEVSSCSAFAHSKNRIRCFKEHLGIDENIATIAEACETTACREALNEKLLTLLKLRLYNLELQAARLLEKEMIEPAAYSTFIVAMEHHKRALQQATSKAKVTAIIEEAIVSWKMLIEKTRNT